MGEDQFMGQDDGMEDCALADDLYRWRIALESAEAGVWDYDLSRSHEIASDCWYTMRGLDPVKDRETGVQRWLERLHPEDVEHMQRFIDQMNNGELPDLSCEYRERHAAGQWIWILCRGKTIFDDQGKAARFIGTDTDITALKTADLELRKMSERFEFAISHSKIGMWEFEPGANRMNWDRNTCELFGVDSNKMLEPELWERRLHPEDRERARAVAAEAMKNGSGYTMDYRIVLPSGTVRHVRSRAAFMPGCNNCPKLVGLNWDVSEDYARAQELQNSKLLAELRNEELEAARLQMEYGALHDALTGLPNRRQLDKKLASIQASVISKVAERIAILHIDLDRFKEINDSLGHLAGDVTLQRAANILRDCAPQRALVSRAGGDEFIVIVERAADDDALARLAGLIIERMQEPVSYGGQECSFGASIGISVAVAGSMTGRQMLFNSDLALYQAKENGRNRYCFFTAEMDAQASARKRCSDDILAGLERREFFPVYQLQFDSKSMEIVGVEVLARWNHPERGVLLPADFLAVAKEMNVVARIDEAVFALAHRDVQKWRDGGIEVPRISFNLSADQLADQRIINMLREHAFESASIAIDLEASSILDGKDAAVADNLSELRKRGIGLEIADFGTGQASIERLVSLRPQRFKIDSKLLQDIVVSVEQRRLAKAIISIGKALGIEVVATGVENKEQVQVLRRMDCDVLQGYGLAIPMTADALAEFVGRQGWRKAG
jgi:diguanylate cyclase (GGDEF)-like protein/PAS domain S-box-containing protein